MRSELSDFARHAGGVRQFLRTPLTRADTLARLKESLEKRGERFLATVEAGVFVRPSSPYLPLFQHAGIEPGDLRALVRDDGVDATVDTLYEEGVRISLDEFRGRRPIERSGLSLYVTEEDFDNPLARVGWRTTTGGSRSLGRQVLLNLEHMERNALYYMLFLIAHDAFARPEALWRPLTSRTGVNNALRTAQRRKPIEKWFSQTRFREQRFGDAALTAYALLAARVWAAPLPAPEYVPFGKAERIARWLEGRVRAGRPPMLMATVGSCTRIAIAAREHGCDMAGTLFRSGGEALTPARADTIAATGAKAFADYSFSEVGRVGVSCADPAAVGDVHLLLDKIAMVQRERVVPTTGETVGALFFTSLLPSAPKLMINVENDDYATVEDRECACPIGALGFSRHLHGIRSYEKLTSEGVTLRGTDVLTLLERTLPGRFGGSPTDYQLVEDVAETVPVLSVVVSPRLGSIDEQEVVSAVLSALERGGPRAAAVAKVWANAGTLRVVRREPYATSAAKILPIHVKISEDG